MLNILWIYTDASSFCSENQLVFKITSKLQASFINGFEKIIEMYLQTTFFVTLFSFFVVVSQPGILTSMTLSTQQGS